VFKDCNFQIKRDKRPHIYSAVQFEEIFALPRTETESEVATMGTVHSVKGRSLDAVFVALKSKGASESNYTNLLGSDLLQSEELRIVYVAVTRAKRALALAVPQASLPQWQGFLWPPTNP
jgi:superfamily I DNA/RNA helicase